MEELYEKLANKSLTIGEAIELGVHKSTNPSMKKDTAAFEKMLNRMGFSSDLPLSILEEESAIKKIAEQYDIEGGGEPFKGTKSLWKRLNAAANEKDFAPTYVKEPFAFGKDQGFHPLTSDQRRRTAKMTRVPEAKITFKGMLSAIAEIEEPQIRAAVLANMFMPIRPGEIANLRFEDVEFKTITRDGVEVLTADISEFSRGVDGRPVKTRPFLEVQGPAAELLRHQTNLAKQRGDDMLFSILGKDGKPRQLTTDDMSTAVGTGTKEGPMARFFNSEEIQKVTGRKFKGVNDIRKFVPSIIARQLGYGAIADKIMGHAGAKLAEGISEVGDKHYISDIYYEGEVGPEGKALLANQHLIAEVNDIETLNALPKAVGIEIPGYTDSNVVTPTQKFKKESNIPENFKPREATPEEIENSRLVTEEANAKLSASIEESELRGLEAKTAKDKLIVESGAISEEVARIQVQEQELKNEKRRKIRGEKKAEVEAAEKEARTERTKSFFEKATDLMNKLPSPVKKAIPIAGTAAALQAASVKKAEAEEAFGRGDILTGGVRSFQAVEEVVSPLPITTGDVEDIAESVGERTPEQEEFLSRSREERAERMKARRKRVTSAQMDELMSK